MGKWSAKPGRRYRSQQEGFTHPHSVEHAPRDAPLRPTRPPAWLAGLASKLFYAGLLVCIMRGWFVEWRSTWTTMMQVCQTAAAFPFTHTKHRTAASRLLCEARNLDWLHVPM